MTRVTGPFDEAGKGLSESQWRDYVGAWVRDGVVPGRRSELRPFGDSSGLLVKVDPGSAILAGFWLDEDAQQTVTVSSPHATLQRRDRLVLRLDLGANTITLLLKAGTSSTSPSAPSVQRDATVYEIALATVTVPNGATTITSANVQDERSNPNVCGWAATAYQPWRCTSTTRPQPAPPGLLIYEDDTGTLLANRGTFATPVWSSVGATAHSALTGLSADDHPQYLTGAEGNAAYATIGHTHGVNTVVGTSESQTLSNKVLDAPRYANNFVEASGTYQLPNPVTNPDLEYTVCASGGDVTVTTPAGSFLDGANVVTTKLIKNGAVYDFRARSGNWRIR